MDKSECAIVKVFTVKDSSGHTYYVQRMPGYYGMGLRFAVMLDRRRLIGSDFRTGREAIGWLLAYLCRDLDQLGLQL